MTLAYDNKGKNKNKEFERIVIGKKKRYGLKKGMVLKAIIVLSIVAAKE